MCTSNSERYKVNKEHKAPFSNVESSSIGRQQKLLDSRFGRELVLMQIDVHVNSLLSEGAI